ncbi:Hsp33 family molecular chaperone HslO [Neptunicella sp. SCSIO 80796]|uniref:Hsp33 family molecular chaperone HslO n=1 Tax=Neptunicella plasticusilytica TaxID=3117012 RepID=UPI003A4E12AB
MNSSDQLYRYLFRQADVRGEIVQLQDSFKAIIGDHQYPLPIQRLLGELLAATSLLTATLKFEGDIAVQLQSEGVIKYIVVNGTNEQKMRGIARWQGEVPEGNFSQLFEKGILAITITPKEGERYQGIVALDKPSLAECLQAYFLQSEQLLTKVILHTRIDSSSVCAGGMLLQALPASDQNDPAQFEHLGQLTDTITADELFDLSAQDVLYRLYHQEEVELYPPQSVVFSCGCSKTRSATALTSVDKQELLDIVTQEGFVAMHCQYCNTEYRFDAIDIEAIHSCQYDENALPQ